jgi:REP element-mobilizing transposase RayT
MPHASRETFGKTFPGHVTVRVRSYPDLPSLRDVRVVRQLEKSFAAGCERSDFRLVHYSLQENHAHFIVEARDQVALGRGMMAIGSRLARAVNRVRGDGGSVLADRYHHRLLRTPREVRNALRYVLLNARHHMAVKARPAIRRMEALLDPASSARWFDGWKNRKRNAESASESAAGRQRSPVAGARTWLLTVGWRRHGLLEPADVPG